MHLNLRDLHMQSLMKTCKHKSLPKLLISILILFVGARAVKLFPKEWSMEHTILWYPPVHIEAVSDTPGIHLILVVSIVFLILCLHL